MAAEAEPQILGYDGPRAERVVAGHNVEPRVANAEWSERRVVGDAGQVATRPRESIAEAAGVSAGP